MDIISKFKGQGIKIEKTKSRHEVFTSLFSSGSAIIQTNFRQMTREVSGIEKQLEMKNS